MRELHDQEKHGGQNFIVPDSQDAHLIRSLKNDPNIPVCCPVARKH